MNALAEIDELFTKYGIQVNGHSKSVRQSKAKTKLIASKAKKTRRKFPETAEAMIRSLVRGNGRSTADINKAWQASGRGGSANNTLGAMVKKKRIKRRKAIIGKGSIYTLK
jgi:hypothetical protein